MLPDARDGASIRSELAAAAVDLIRAEMEAAERTAAEVAHRGVMRARAVRLETDAEVWEILHEAERLASETLERGYQEADALEHAARAQAAELRNGTAQRILTRLQMLKGSARPPATPAALSAWSVRGSDQGGGPPPALSAPARQPLVLDQAARHLAEPRSALVAPPAAPPPPPAPPAAPPPPPVPVPAPTPRPGPADVPRPPQEAPEGHATFADALRARQTAARSEPPTMPHQPTPPPVQSPPQPPSPSPPKPSESPVLAEALRVEEPDDHPIPAAPEDAKAPPSTDSLAEAIRRLRAGFGGPHAAA